MNKLAILGAVALAAGSAWAADYDVYVGTYTQGDSKGIYRLTLDDKTGKLSEKSLSATTPNPSFLAMSPNGKYMFAVNETGPQGKVSSFSISPDSGALTFISDSSTRGDGPCHLSVDKGGRNIVAANYGGGSLAVIPVLPDGRLQPASDFIQHQGASVNKSRQSAPHAHGAFFDASGRYLYAPDLGLDQVKIYKLNEASGKLTPAQPPFGEVKAGSGPRHIALHPKANYAYVINEITCTITAFERDPGTGALKEMQSVSTLPEGAEFKPAYSTAEIEVHPSGKFLYGSNRGHDTIAVYAIEAKTGQLTLQQHISSGGKNPRAFALTPDGKWLIAANQNSANLVVFKVDGKTGKLSETGNTASVPFPVSILYRKK
jgi:6-phosphogluconolactonase